MSSGTLLACAIFFEVIGTTFMKISDGFTIFWASLSMILSYVISFASLTLCIRKMEITIAYAIWSAVGTALITVIGALFFGEDISLIQVVCLLLIILGVIGLNFKD